VNRLFYIIDSGNFVDTIGSEFDVVLAGDSIAPSDVKLLVDGSELTGVIDPNNSNVINFGTLDTNTNLYPYTLTYEDGNSEKLTLQINLPVDYSQPLQLKYKVKLNRSTTPGWHENVKLNESAIVNYTDSAGQEGSATFPVPSTNYYVPYDYKVVYDGNGGSGSTVDSNSPYEENSSVTVKDNNFTRDGYTFVSWNTSADGSGTSYAPNATFNITEDTTLYAIWKKIPQAMDVTLKYDTNGASNIKNINSTVYQIGDKVVVKEPEYSKVVSNFKFLGWNTKADGTGTMYQPGDVFTINKDTILYAIYTNTPPLKKTGNDNLYSALIIGLICMSGIAVLVNYRKE
ncbi:MAG: InlB B-repeat-containing protein, partial [Bacilli bacterium]|nr:InlB B-repeat-containing protein [Bacilli bacterium]